MKPLLQHFLSSSILMRLAIAASAKAGISYQVINLTPPGSTFAIATGVSGNEVVGYASMAGYADAAALWTNGNPNPVDLAPAGSLESNGLALVPGTQVGQVEISQATVAALWHGTSASFVNLSVPGYNDTVAAAISGSQIVGSASADAGPFKGILWNSVGGTYVPTNLTPNGYAAAQLTGVENGVQVGTVTDSSGTRHAGLWTGSAASFVDLSPAGYTDSFVYGIGGGQIVGSATGPAADGSEHAILWTGPSATSFVDLNGPGLSSSRAEAAGDGMQVGSGAGTETGEQSHAIVWMSSPDNYVDLQQFLPASEGYIDSIALGIDSQGDIVGYAENAAGAQAIEWVPQSVPLPPGLWPAIGLLLIITTVLTCSLLARCVP